MHSLTKNGEHKQKILCTFQNFILMRKNENFALMCGNENFSLKLCIADREFLEALFSMAHYL